MEVSGLFKLSILLRLSILTVAHGGLQVVEAVIVIAFSLCTHETMSFESDRKKNRWKYLVNILVYLAQIGISSYSIWFWFAESGFEPAANWIGRVLTECFLKGLISWRIQLALAMDSFSLVLLSSASLEHWESVLHFTVPNHTYATAICDARGVGRHRRLQRHCKDHRKNRRQNNSLGMEFSLHIGN